jgi:hypothetical protein
VPVFVPFFALNDVLFAIPVAETTSDLNGDGDSDDLVLHAASLEDRDRDGRFDFADDCIGGARRCSPRR